MSVLAILLFIKDNNFKMNKYKNDSIGRVNDSIFEFNVKATRKNVTQTDVGLLKMDQNGYSIGTQTELTELSKQLNNEDIDIIEITWIWDSAPKYPEMPMKIIYNKIDHRLQEIYTLRNVIEDYKNIDPKCLEQFLKAGEKSFDQLGNYCKDSEHDFNNRKMR